MSPDIVLLFYIMYQVKVSLLHYIFLLGIIVIFHTLRHVAYPYNVTHRYIMLLQLYFMFHYCATCRCYVTLHIAAMLSIVLRYAVLCIIVTLRHVSPLPLLSYVSLVCYIKLRVAVALCYVISCINVTLSISFRSCFMVCYITACC